MSSTYNQYNLYNPANLSIDNDTTTYAEADTGDTSSWLLMAFSHEDINVTEVTLVLFNTDTGRSAEDVR